MSWNDCLEFCRETGLRLPTEAEWEYACRAGTTGAYGGTGRLQDMGWYADNSACDTHRVGKKQPNAWGLYDMHGNVSEWCADWYGDYPKSAVENPKGPDSGRTRVERGGNCSVIYASDCRSAIRYESDPDDRNAFLGFRPIFRQD